MNTITDDQGDANDTSELERELDIIMEDLIVGHNFDYAKGAILRLIAVRDAKLKERLMRTVPRKQHKYKTPNSREAGYNEAVGNCMASYVAEREQEAYKKGHIDGQLKQPILDELESAVPKDDPPEDPDKTDYVNGMRRGYNEANSMWRQTLHRIRVKHGLATDTKEEE